MKAIRNIYYQLRKRMALKPLYDYTFKRFLKYSSRNDTEESAIGNLTMAAHGIEKGLTMGNFRPAFGRDRLLGILEDGEKYIRKYGLDNIQIYHIANIVNDYNLCHIQIGYDLDNTLKTRMDSFLSHFNCPSDSKIQINCTRDSYFSKNHADFYEFCHSRHSCRNFDVNPIHIEIIDKAIALAQTAPSACNRQPVRVYVVETKEKIAKVLSVHGGTRGFSQTIDKLILVCGYLPCYHSKERDCVYTDCGIFAMNLAYSLHYYEVGACILNWSVENKDDMFCREIIGLPDEEVITCLIACGNVPNTFKVCNSGKKDLNRIIHHIK